jgi:putative transposase
MRDWQSQSHVRWYCKYHIVFVPKYRRRVIYGQLRRSIGRIIRELCQQQGVELAEGHAMPDYVHLCLSSPPKFSVANTVGWLKEKSAIRIHRECLGRERNFTGLHFWARGSSTCSNSWESGMLGFITKNASKLGSLCGMAARRAITCQVVCWGETCTDADVGHGASGAWWHMRWPADR